MIINGQTVDNLMGAARKMSNITEYNGPPCNVNPCMNGGVCIPILNSAECRCPYNYMGQHCEKRESVCPFTAPQLNPALHLSVGWECNVCSCFPTPAHSVIRAGYPPLQHWCMIIFMYMWFCFCFIAFIQCAAVSVMLRLKGADFLIYFCRPVQN